MQFKSTRKLEKTSLVTFKDAILRCIPQGGGLYIPAQVPDLRSFFYHMDSSTNYREFASTIAANLLQGELNPYSAAWVANSAFYFEPRLVKLDKRFSLLDLSVGPTGVFKDFGIAFLAAIMEEFLKNSGSAMVVTAARGDIGTSIANAFNRRKNITSVILYPEGKVRGIDTENLLKNGGNIIPLQVAGSLDDCNALVDMLIRDPPFAERYRITSANAVNPARLLSQAFYYMYAFIQLKEALSGPLYFSVPSGNFGNLIGGLYAWKFGLPAEGFIAAQNENNPLASLVNKNSASKPRATFSPALDVTHPSNMERLLSFYEEAPAVMRSMVSPSVITDGQARAAMEFAYKEYGVLLDPNSAVAFAAAREAAAEKSFYGHIVVLVTGHPANYAEAVFNVTGVDVSVPERIALLKKESQPCAVIDNDLLALETAIAASY